MKEESAKIRELQQRIALYEDMKAYQLLYEMLFKGIHGFSYAFVKSSEVAEEIVSDVFIKLWQIRNELMAIENLKVYLFIIAKHFSLNYITKHHKNPIVSLDEMEADTLIELGDPEEICISSDTLENIREAVRQLPPQCRLVFQLVKEEGLKYKEVAAILHISILTVRNQVTIATRKIAAHLGRPQLTRPAPPPRKFSDS